MYLCVYTVMFWAFCIRIPIGSLMNTWEYEDMGIYIQGNVINLGIKISKYQLMQFRIFNIVCLFSYIDIPLKCNARMNFEYEIPVKNLQPTLTLLQLENYRSY